MTLLLKKERLLTHSKKHSTMMPLEELNLPPKCLINIKKKKL